jgi:hypothetical protein
VLLNVWRSVFINETLTTVYLPRFHGVSAHRYKDIAVARETNEIMQFEGTAAGATALCEMLVHTQGGVTKVFPAVPSTWREAGFRDLPQPGGFLVSAEREKARTQRVEVVARRAGTLTLAVPGWSEAWLEKDGSGQAVTLPVRVDLKAGEKAVFLNRE